MSIRDDIWGMDLIFAAKTLRETREAIEEGAQFKSDSAVRALDDCIKEARRIEYLLAHIDARHEHLTNDEEAA